MVAEGHNIFEVTKRLFVVGGHHSLFRPNATTFEELQWPETVRVLCEARYILERCYMVKCTIFDQAILG